MITTAILAAAAIPLVAAHGLITSPTPRAAGATMASICGQQIFNQQSSDPAGNIQGELQVVQSDFTSACSLWLCKGMQFADNTANVQSYTAGESVSIHFDLRAPHTGVANVSIVDTATNTIIGDTLISWDVFASNSQARAADEADFGIVIPDLGSRCTTAGECVIQHFWDARDIDQTYESCIDFTVGGASGDIAVSTSSVVGVSTAAVSSSTKVVSVESTSTQAATSATSVVPVVSTSVASVSPAISTTLLATTLSTVVRSSSSSAVAPTSTGSTVAKWGQCGGINFTGSTACVTGTTCIVQNPYYSQCL